MPDDQIEFRSTDLYEQDFFAWTQQQAQLLRDGRFSELDLENLIEEVACVGRSERKEINSRLKIIIAHLIKWRFQPGARSPSWRGTIDEQRSKVAAVLSASPSLKRYPGERLKLDYLSARLLAAKETGIDFSIFSEDCPFTIEQILDENFWPKEVGLYDQS